MTYLIILGIILLFTLFMGIRVEIADRNHNKIIAAIAKYSLGVIANSPPPWEYQVTFDDMEDFDTTMWRIWDWGYMRILPPDKYEIIKEFIEE